MHLDLTEQAMIETAQSDVALRRSQRFVGLIGGILGFVCAILMLPFGFGVLAQMLLFSMGMMVLFNGLGFAMMDRLKGKGSRLAAALMLLLPLALVGAGLGAALALAVGAILLLEGFAFRNRENRRALALAALISGFILAVAVAVEPSLGTVLVLLAAMLPSGVLMSRMLRAPRETQGAASAADPVLLAHLKARLGQSGGAQLLVDISGGIDAPVAGAPFELMLAGEIGVGTSLIEACLIADRPPVLMALARAIRDRLASAPMIIRLKTNAGASALAPPRFAAWRCVVVPAEGLPERAVILLDPDLEPAVSSPGIDAMLLQRAMHDTVSPFNAGIGYLDMLSDPVLAPVENGKKQDYAREAAHALRLAHRNTQCLGRWLRLAERAVDEPRRVAPIVLIEDVTSAMMRQSEGLKLCVEGAALLPSVLADADTARFAIEVLLRPLFESGGTLHASLDVRGLVLEAVPRRANMRPDALQNALEDAVRRHCAGQISLNSDGSRSLILRVGIVLDEHKDAAERDVNSMPKGLAGPESLRQAS